MRNQIYIERTRTCLLQHAAVVPIIVHAQPKLPKRKKWDSLILFFFFFSEPMVLCGKFEKNNTKK